MTSEPGPLTIEHRKLNALVGLVVLAWFALVYRVATRRHPLGDPLLALTIVALVSLIVLLLARWVDRAVLDRRAGRATRFHGIWPLIRETATPLADVQAVTIAAYGGPGQMAHFSFAVDLAEAAGGTYRLLGCFPAEFAWKTTVRVARYLDLPVRDLLSGEYEWPSNRVPDTLAERLQRR